MSTNNSSGYGYGISAISGSTITATNVTVNASTSGNPGAGDPGAGLRADTGGRVTFTGTAITTTGVYMYGIYASNATVTASGVGQSPLAITTNSSRGHGIYANAETFGGGTINLSNATITTSGTSAYGIYAARQSQALGDAVATINVNNVTVNTALAAGIYAKAGSVVTGTNLNVTTTGTGVQGATIQGVDGSIIGPAILTMNGGSLRATGANAAALTIYNAGTFSGTGTTLASTGASINTGMGTTGQVDIKLGQGSVATQNNGTLLTVARPGAASGNVVNLTLSGSIAAGNIIDAGATGAGGTYVAIANGAVLTGGFQGAKGVTFDGGTLVSNGNVGFTGLTLAAGGGVIDTRNIPALAITTPIDGSGSLTKQGAGVLTLSGANTYSGDTIVQEGTLQLASNLNPVTDLVVNGGSFSLGALTQTVASLSGTGGTTDIGTGALTLDQAVDTTYAGAIAGQGSLTKTGSGTLGLTGTSSFSGATAVTGGTLMVEGSLASSVVSVSQGATLAGSGTVGGIAANANAIVSPGSNGIGTLNVAGNILFNPNAIYRVEVNAAGQADRLQATGTAQLNGGNVQVLAQPGTYAPFTPYLIMRADGGVSGQFAGVTSNYAFLHPSLVYTPNTVLLTLDRNNIRFMSVAVTPNHVGVANAAEALDFGHPVYNAVLQLDAPSAQRAFDHLSGEIHASLRSTLLEDSRFVRDALLSRLRQDGGALQVEVTAGIPGRRGAAPVYAPQYGLWGQGFGSWGQTDANRGIAKVDRSTGGFLIGADGDPGFGAASRFGLAGGYSSTTIDAKARLSSAHIDSYHAALYGGTSLGAIGLRLGGSYTWHDIDTSRAVTFPGFADALSADYRARTAQIFGEAGYKIGMRSAVIEPFAGLAYVNLDTDRFRENGGAAALNGRGDSESVTYTTLGVHASSAIAVSEITNLTLKGTLGWRHAFDEVRPTALLGFGTGLPFQVTGAPVARNALVVESEIGTQLYDNVSVGIGYMGQIANEVQDHGIKGKFLLTF